MCGRFTQDYTWAEIHALYQLTAQPPQNLAPSWNVAPTDDAGVIVRDGEGARRFRKMRWGLLPFWAKDIREGAKLINARCESLAEKPAFRTALKERRCLVPAGGFYEWKREGSVKQPWFITRADGAPLTMAGLRESRRGKDAAELQSFTILTTSANGFMSALHDRMPVVLEQDEFDPWLSEGGTELLRPAAENVLRRWPVSAKMNSWKQQRAGLHRAAGRGRAGVVVGERWVTRTSPRSAVPARERTRACSPSQARRRAAEPARR